nr:hypothetical protein [Tanacetum cinerariifolium]
VNPDGQQQSSSMSSQFVTSMLNPTPDARIEFIFEATSQMDVQTPTSVAPLPTIDENMQKIIKEQVKEQTSYAVAAGLSEMELKKILIEKIEGNKSIHRSNEQRNLYKALVEAYESHKIILDTYRDTVTLKRRHDNDADKDEEPSARSDRGSKRQREGKEPESASAPKEKATRSAGNLYHRYRTPEVVVLSHLITSSTTTSSFFVEVPQAASIQILSLRQRKQITGTTSRLKTWCLGQCGFKNRLAATSMLSGESPIGGANVNNSTVLLSTGSLLAMSTLSVESSLSLNPRLQLQKAPHSRHRRYVTASGLRKAGKSDSRRMLCFQRLFLNVYKKHRNPKACGKPSTRCRKLPEEAQPNKNKDKHNRLMRIDELHKFSDGTLTDVRTALDDRLKGIQIKYLPQSIWRKSDKDRAATMIQAIDKQLKIRRIMRSFERFVSGMLYGGDFRMRQMSI